MKNKFYFKSVLIIFVLLVSIGILNAEETVNNITGTQWKASDKVLVSWGTNVETPKSIGESNSFKVNSGGTLSVSYKGDSRTYGNLDSGKRNEFIFDKLGNLKEAYFTPSQNGKYRLGNKEFNVPSGADVIFKNGVATIMYKDKAKLEKPTTIDSINDLSEDISMEYHSDKGFILENGEEFSGVLKYKAGFYFDSDARIGALEIKDSSHVPTYLFYDGEPKDIGAAYISINKEKGKITVGCNVDEIGPAVKFNEGNSYGVKIEKNDYFVMRPLGNSQGSYISVQNREKENKVPYVETLNQFVMDQDGKSVYFNSNDGKLYLKTNGNLIEEFKNNMQNSGSTPLEIHGFKTFNGQKVDISQYKNILGIGNQNNFGYGPDPKFIKTHVPEYYRQKKAPGLYSGFSNSLTYNYDLTLRGLKKFTGISVSDSTGLTNDPKNVQMLMDIFASLPADSFKKWGITQFNLVNSMPAPYWGAIGLADWTGEFWIKANGGFNPGVIRHELTHLHDFASSKSFRSEWSSIGGNSGPHTYDYGYTSWEDTSTFGEFVYRTDPWKEWLSDSYKYHDKFRGRIAIFTKYGFMSRAEAARLYSIAGLPADASDATLQKYINAAKNTYKSIGIIIILGRYI